MESIRDFLKNKSTLIWQFIKFGLVGLSNTGLSLAIYYTLISLNVNYIIANVIAFLLSVLNAYYWNNRFVFSKKAKGHLKPLIRVYLSYGFTFLLGTVLLFIMVRYMDISKYIAPLINLVITVPINFLVNKLWAFK